MIEARNLGKTYPDRTVALEGLNLRIVQGEFVILAGRSGAGKTTLFKLILGAEVPSAGVLTVYGHSVARLSLPAKRELRRKVGVVFQDFRLLKGRTAYDNVALGLRVLGLSGVQVRHRSLMALESVGLRDKLGSRVETLSWGEQQRVAVARALARRPDLILADEPTGNLDSATAAGVIELLLAANREGATVVMATHSRSLIDRPEQRVVVLEEGRIIYDGAGEGYFSPGGLRMEASGC